MSMLTKSHCGRSTWPPPSGRRSRCHRQSAQCGVRGTARHNAGSAPGRLPTEAGWPPSSCARRRSGRAWWDGCDLRQADGDLGGYGQPLDHTPVLVVLDANNHGDFSFRNDVLTQRHSVVFQGTSPGSRLESTPSDSHHLLSAGQRLGRKPPPRPETTTI